MISKTVVVNLPASQFYRAWEEHAKVKKTERFYNCCIQKYEYENGIFTLVEIFNRNITE